jgi:hypothetical protein
MFIERSTARIRMLRTVFVLLGILPCAGLCGWAAMRHSDGHREAIERRCEQVIGLPLAIGTVEHVRPNAMRLRDCRLSSSGGAVVLSVPVIDVESSSGELRLTLGRLDCTPELARTLAGLARDWLRQPVRFPVDCVIDVHDFSWRPRPHADVGPVANSLHVECVAANGSRAVRVRRSADRSSPADEVRLVAGVVGSPGGQDDDTQPQVAPRAVEHTAAGMEVHGSIVEPLPVDVLEAAAGLEAGTLPLGAGAVVSGSVAAVLDGGVSSGSARVRVEQVDLAAASRHLPHRLAGEALLDIDGLEWSRGRITACGCQLSVSRGRVGQPLLDACVSMLGCRPGPAYRSLAREEVRSFDDVSVRLGIENGAVDVRAEPGRDGALARVQGLSIVDQPQVPVPLDRLAWLLAPPGSAAVPAAKVTAWLIGCFAIDAQMRPPVRAAQPSSAAGQGAGGSSEKPPDQAGRPLRRAEF